MAWASVAMYPRVQGLERFSAGLLQAAMDELDDGIVAVDDAGRIRWVNAAAAGLFGHRFDDLVGRDVRMLVPVWPVTRDEAGLDLGGVVAVSRDGLEVPMRVVWSPQEDDGGLLLVTDPAAGGAGGARILADNRRLEGLVEVALAEVEDARRGADDFAASVAHELHGLLRSVQGFSSIVLAEHEGSLPEDAARMLDRAVRAVDALGVRLEALQRLDRVGRQALRPERLDMHHLVRSALEETRRAQARGGGEVDVRIHPLPDAWGDGALVLELLRELFSNAWKAVRSRASGRIDVGWSKGHGDAYYVRDDGIGFDARPPGSPFEVFRRLHTQEVYDGTGVGLTVAERIVGRLGGRIWAESEPGGGATFYFTLPRAAGARNGGGP